MAEAKVPFIDDRVFRVPLYSTVCSYCKHFHVKPGRECDAFPEIPLEIWLGKNDHKKPFAGDRGIQFEPVASTAAAQK